MSGAPPVIREVTCRTVLNKSKISDYSLNCYVGCQHGCVYCYARFMQRFHPHAEPWGEFVDVKVDAADVLRGQLRRAKPGNVFMSSACDGWQPLEEERGLTRECCQLLLEHGFQVNILTKSALVLRDLPLLILGKARVGVTITTLDERLAGKWERESSSVAERLRILDEAKVAGLDTAVMFGPLLPFLSDSQQSLNGLFEQAAARKVDVIWVDALNPRPKVWPSVAAFLQREDRDLLPKYSKMLFDKSAREHYLDQVRRRVHTAASRVGLTGRLAGCP